MLFSIGKYCILFKILNHATHKLLKYKFCLCFDSFCSFQANYYILLFNVGESGAPWAAFNIFVKLKAILP